MLLFGSVHLRALPLADLHARLAAGCKHAPFGQGEQIGDLAADRLHFGEIGKQAGRGADEPVRIGMQPVVEHLVDGAVLHQPPRVHDSDVIGKLGDDADVVRQQDHGDALFPVDLGEDAEDVVLRDDVERRRRLVEDDDLGLQKEREGDHDALLHPSREFVRIAVHHARSVQPHALQKLRDMAAVLLIGLPHAVIVRRLVKLLADLHERVEGALRRLKDHGDAAPAIGGERALVERADADFGRVLPAEQNVPFHHLPRRGDVAQDARDERRFAAARFPDDGGDLAADDGERDLVHRTDGDILHLILDGHPFKL